MKKTIALISIILLCGCSVVIVWTPKTMKITGKDNKATIIGSDLKDNAATQRNSGQLKIPLLP